MLTENHITDLLEKYFTQQNFEVNKLTTTQKGVDMKVKDLTGKFIYIEVKGETSANPKSKRFGQYFSGNQIWNHGSVALMKTFLDMSKPENKNVKFALGVPLSHEKMFRNIEPIIRKLDIAIYLVAADKIKIF